MKDIFDQAEECGYVATKDGSEIHKVLYVDRERDFILTENKEILRLGDGCFWTHRNAFNITESVYFYPHKQKQKYYQWVLLSPDNVIVTTSLNEVNENIINNISGYFTKENPPYMHFSCPTHKWIPILETEKEA